MKQLQLLAAASVLLCAMAIVAQSPIRTDRIDAKLILAHEFDLVNPAGRITARLVSDPKNQGSPDLVMLYPSGQPAILIGVDSETGSSISVLNAKGQPRASITEGLKGPYLALFDEDDKLRVAVDASNRSPTITIYDARLKKRWTVPVN